MNSCLILNNTTLLFIISCTSDASGFVRNSTKDIYFFKCLVICFFNRNHFCTWKRGPIILILSFNIHETQDFDLIRHLLIDFFISASVY